MPFLHEGLQFASNVRNVTKHFVTMQQSLEWKHFKLLYHNSFCVCCSRMLSFFSVIKRINGIWLITMYGMKRGSSSLESRTCLILFPAQSPASMLCLSKEEKMLYKSNAWFTLGTYSFRHRLRGRGFQSKQFHDLETALK